MADEHWVSTPTYTRFRTHTKLISVKEDVNPFMSHTRADTVPQLAQMESNSREIKEHYQ